MLCLMSYRGYQLPSNKTICLVILILMATCFSPYSFRVIITVIQNNYGIH